MSAEKTTTTIQTQVQPPHLPTQKELKQSEDPTINSIAHGEVPTRGDLTETIERAKDALDERAKECDLTTRGELLVEDAKAILDSTKKFVNEKDFTAAQHLVQDTKDATKEMSKEAKQFGKDVASSVAETVGLPNISLPSHLPNLTIPSITLAALPTIASNLPNIASNLPNITSNLPSLQQVSGAVNSISDSLKSAKETGNEFAGDGKAAFHYGKEIILYILKSSEFKGVLVDMIDFFQNLVVDSADKADRIGDSLKQDINSQSASLPHARKELKEVGSEVKDSVLSTKGPWSEEKRTQVYNRFRGLLERASKQPEMKELMNLYWKWIEALKERAEQAKEKIQEKAEELKDKAQEKGEELKEKAKEKLEEVKEKAQEKGEEIKEKVKEKGEEVKEKAKEKGEEIKEKAKEKGQEIKEKGREVKEKVKQDAKQVDTSSMDKIWYDIADLVDQFAGKGSFESFCDKNWELFCAILDDEEASWYFADLKAFIVDAMDHPKDLNTDSKVKEGTDLLQRGSDLVQSSEWRDKFNETFDNGKKLLEKIKNDETTNELFDRLRQFGEHFALDDKGRPDIYVIQESLGQMKDILYPIFRDTLGSLTVGKVIGTSENYDFSIENLKVVIPELLPQFFELKTKSDLKVDLADMKTKTGYVKVTLELSQLKPSFKDIKFWYKRKSFPKIEDEGHADVDLSAGEGMRIKVVWRIKAPTGHKPFTLSLIDVKCTVDKMDINVKDAKHDIIDKLAMPIARGNIKQQIAQGVVDAIVSAVQPVNDTMNQWFATRPLGSIKDKVNEAIHDAFESTNQVLHNHPVDKTTAAVNNKLEGAKESAKDYYDEAKEKLSETKESMKEKATEVKDKVNEVRGMSKEEMMDKADELKGKAADKASEMKDSAKEKLGDAKQKVEKKMDNWDSKWSKNPTYASIVGK